MWIRHLYRKISEPMDVDNSDYLSIEQNDLFHYTYRY